MTRFPERLEVNRAEYTALVARLAAVESNAAHKDAIKDVVLATSTEVAKIRDEMNALKFALGMASQAEGSGVVLNGETL